MVAVADPGRVDVGGAADAVGAGILRPAQVEEDLSVGTGHAGDEKNEVVRACELHQMLVPVRDLGADGVMDRDTVAEGADAGADVGVLIGALGGLGEDFHGFREVDAGEDVLQHGPVFHDDGVAVHLAQKAHDLGMADFPEDDECSVLSVRVQAGIGFADVLLQLEYHGAGAVDDGKAVAAGMDIGRRRLAMGPDEDGFAFGHVGNGRDRAEPFRPEAVELGLVMDDGAEGIQVVVVREEVLRPGDGADDASAETGAVVDFDGYHVRDGASRMANLPWMTPRHQTSSSWRVMWVLSITYASSG